MKSRISNLQATLREAHDNLQTPEARLKILSQRKAATALQGISEAELDKFRELRLVRIPTPTIEVST